MIQIPLIGSPHLASVASQREANSISRLAPFLLALSLTGTALAAPKPTKAQSDAAEAAFKKGATLMEGHKYAAALVQFQKALAVFPNEPDILWNTGTAALENHQMKLAATYFEREVKSEPQNGQLYAHLLQCYQEIGDVLHRDAMRAKLFAMHRSGKDESGYTQKDRFCRDEFTLQGNQVFAFEKFARVPREQGQAFLAPRYIFLMGQANDDKAEPIRMEAGWDTVEPDGQGGFRPAKENNTFYFDVYYPTGEYSRKTYGLSPTEPTYEGVKQRFIAIMAGKIAMTSGRKRADTGPGD